MPVGLQVMCRRVEEEVALALAEFIVKALYDLNNTVIPSASR